MPQEAARDEAREAALKELLRPKTPGERIAFLRKDRGWSQSALAARIRDEGGSCSGKWKVCRWEQGMYPKPPTRQAIARALGVEEGVIFGEEAVSAMRTLRLWGKHNKT